VQRERKPTITNGRFLVIQLQLFGIGIGFGVACHHLKHPVNHADMELHMPVQAGAESVDESDCAQVQGLFVPLRRPRTLLIQALRSVGALHFAAWPRATGSLKSNPLNTDARETGPPWPR